MEEISVMWLVGVIAGILLCIVRRKDQENNGTILLATGILIFLFIDSLDLSRYSSQIETGKFYLGWAMLFTLFVLLIATIIGFFDRFNFKHKEVVITLGIIGAIIALMIAL